MLYTMHVFLSRIVQRSLNLQVSRTLSTASKPTLRGARGHLMLAHTLLLQVLNQGDTVIDATAGNGHDSSFLADLVLAPGSGLLFSLDVQSSALENTRKRLLADLSKKYNTDAAEALLKERVQLLLQNHRVFPDSIPEESVAAVLYNLGYLPGSDKSVTTVAEDTIMSINNAARLLKVGGLISVLAYRGHSGGAEETDAVQKHITEMDSALWSVYSHYPLNRGAGAAVLFTLYKNASSLT